MRTYVILFTAACLLLLCTVAGWSVELTDGVMYAVPTPGGHAPVIDGDLQDWDLSGAEQCWLTSQSAHLQNGVMALMYDDEALYLSARIALPNRGISNPNNPTDGFWWGDEVEFRLAADPTLPAPLDPGNPATAASTRVVHITCWKNSDTNKDYINMTYGAKLNKGNVVNPPGSQVAVKQYDNYYILEARVPWSTLNVPDGKNPFKPGDKMTAIWGIRWNKQGDVNVCYRSDPNSLAFMHPQTWGTVIFSPTGNLPKRHASMDETLALEQSAPVGVPITVQLTEPEKVSINILGPHGEVIRELMGGEPHDAGPVTAHWDGRDQWGAPVPPGQYRWGAYLSKGLKAEYVGTVGTSGNPPYDTADGRGGWGADHGMAVGVAADATGRYFLWSGAEAGRAVVKTDYTGQVLWRKTPFVGGGFGPHYAITANGKYCFITFDRDKPELVRLDAHNGAMLPFGDNKTTPIADRAPVATGNPVHFGKFDPSETSGLACNDHEVFASLYSQNLIRVLDPETGARLREFACPGPRGLALDAQGNLFVVSYAADRTPQVLKFEHAAGQPQPVVIANLVLPYDVAVDAAGHIHVSDLGASQQVKTFTADGALLRALGKPGGRTLFGAYDGNSFNTPLGVAVDQQGGLLVAEATSPKVMSLFDAASGKLIKHWFGVPGYNSANVPDPLDPRTNYYVLEPDGAIARARIPQAGGIGDPNAVWLLPDAGYHDVGSMFDGIAEPVMVLGQNGKKYLVCDDNPHGICLVEKDQLLPVGHVNYVRPQGGAPYLELWSDLNGDHHLQPDEVVKLTEVGGQPLSYLSGTTGSMWMAANGDLYLASMGNQILKIPCAGFLRNGAIAWDVRQATYVVNPVLASLKGGMYCTYRAGIMGMRVDGKGNLYTCFNTTAPYATPELTKAMLAGLGHTSEFNTVKFAKYAPDGHLLWMAGRKATAAAKPGEMYHFWVMGGLVGDQYIAGCSESGQMYFYTQDGFYVDALMENMGLAPPPGPYTFGGETFSGRVQDFPALNQVWAYSCGMAYRVQGFDHGKVLGERRLQGTVTLDHIYDQATTAEAQAAPLTIMPLQQPMANLAAWDGVPVSTTQRNGAPLAAVQLGYDADNLYARIHVADDSPLVNSADTVDMAFKGGDTAGLVLGTQGTREQPILGDIRVMAAMIGGKARLIAMKPLTKLAKHADHYVTPAGGDSTFDFVGEVPGGQVTLTPDADGHGYTALFAVPLAFLEFKVQPGVTLAADVEVRLSGQGARGLQTIARTYLFTPNRSETTMTDDLPTESRLYPRYWGTAVVK